MKMRKCAFLQSGITSNNAVFCSRGQVIVFVVMYRIVSDIGSTPI